MGQEDVLHLDLLDVLHLAGREALILVGVMLGLQKQVTVCLIVGLIQFVKIGLDLLPSIQGLLKFFVTENGDFILTFGGKISIILVENDLFHELHQADFSICFEPIDNVDRVAISDILLKLLEIVVLDLEDPEFEQLFQIDHEIFSVL